ncbi:hypothetical protein MNEG_7379 [Monoraphidium neglectum]|uniref:Uncharacterized protein n=1 Tax=Monoraphidium neglectum TaxID=145388 RepID=A0A0D2JN43_9CHLO|nr:hypothetical protein MNEG_7379 [Monoraphidium neglectum]KIZ00583.1 hypothetical protein MNEG_7379 [Monoraphidium neglectum]|eukprot:XP_013899602.1 hypothetical protein MNEG_7379 [Monoraphidium neglectum]
MSVTKDEVHEFLSSMFVIERQQLADSTVHGCLPAVKGSSIPLKLHPRVEASFPVGIRAHGAEQVAAALATYRALLAGVVSIEVFDVVVSGDKALVVGEQLVRSFLEDAAQALGRALPPWIVAAAAAGLPSVQDGRVPTAVSLSLGKNDAGDPVVTHMAVVFSLPAALCPNLRLPPWQQRAAKSAGDAALRLLRGAGAAAAVVEDIWIAASAAYRAGAAAGGAALDGAAAPAAIVLEGLQSAAAAAAAVAWARVAEGWGERGNIALPPAGAAAAVGR